MTKPISILIAVDHRLIRDGLRELIRGQGDMAVAGETESGRETIRLVRELQPDVVLMDIAMRDLNGIESTRQICREMPGSRIIALSVHANGRFARQMLSAGACGYVLKDSPFEELAQAIRTVASGSSFLSPPIAEMLLRDYIGIIKEEQVSMAPLLSEREREVLQLLAEGFGNKDIAARLGVSVTTIDSHRKHIMDKLDLRSIAALTKFAIREGMTSTD
jgi:DNA-binding NarL/FixJ family response regulator